MNQTHHIFGYHAVVSAIKSNATKVKGIYLQTKNQDKRQNSIIELAQKRNIPIKHVTRDYIDALVEFANHQGVVAEIEMPTEHGENLLKVILKKQAEKSFLLILDGIQDPHNLGACIRTASAAGAHAVIIPKDKACGLTPTVLKVASGAFGTIPVIQVTNLVRTMGLLKEQGVWLYGADESATSSIYQTKLKPPLALVFGGEGKGLRRLTKEHCDFMLSIPMQSGVPNLNVSVAVGVCLFEVVRQNI